MSSTKILISGVGGYWGTRVAQSLSEQQKYHVIGLDTVAPKEPVPGLDFIQADIRNPLLVELFKSEQVEIVCHLAFVETSRPSESAFDHNVMGTMKVFGACAQSGVSKIILKSSTAVYGAKATNPAYLPEETPLGGSRTIGTIRDLIEIEAFCNGFRRQFPEKILTILRYPSIVGPSVESPMMRFLKESFSPSLLGFDPMMQMIHEDDVVNSILHAITYDHPGVFNIAADKLLPLSKVIGLAGKMRLPVFHLFAYWGYGLLGGTGLHLSRHTPIELDYTRYRWVGDLEKMREVLRFNPTFSVEDTLRKIGDQRRSKKYMPEAISRAYDVDRLKRIIERRSQNSNQRVDDPKQDIVEDLEENDHE
jgi:UDP-glucose 4-epimerase